MRLTFRRRLDRLAHRAGSAGRLIVLEIAHDRAEEETLVSDTLANASIDRIDADLLVLLKRYAQEDGAAPCALLSVGVAMPSARGACR